MSHLPLTHAPLLEPQLELEFEPGQAQDLAADYVCTAFLDDGEGLAFLFRNPATGAQVSLIFQHAVLLEAAGRFQSGAVLDNFHRGHYEVGGETREEERGRYFYYLDFIDDDFSVTLAAAAVEATWLPEPPAS